MGALDWLSVWKSSGCLDLKAEGNEGVAGFFLTHGHEVAANALCFGKMSLLQGFRFVLVVDSWQLRRSFAHM